MAADTAQICSAAAATVVPPADQTSSAPEGCSAYRAYYGVSQPADPELARACAFQERNAGTNSDTPFRASAILTMIYANGQGVARNTDLAVKFACEITGGAVAEMEARVDHLRNRSGERRFDLCDDITSGYMGGYCESKESDLADQERSRKIAAILANAPAAERTAFDELRKAGEAYFTLNADSTLGTGGTIRAALEISGAEEQRTLFVDTLARLEKRDRPDGMEGDFAAADRDLNAIYRRLLDWANPEDGTTPDELRKAERAWIAYRDRWLDFARLRYPDLPPDQMKTLLTRERIAAIDSVLHPPH